MATRAGDVVRLLVRAQGIAGHEVPAGTEGVVVDDVGAPAHFAVDVTIDGEHDNVAVGGDEIELVRPGGDRRAGDDAG